MSVKLTKSGQSDISATNITVVSAAQVTCTINLASAATGQWNVMVANSAGQSGIGTDLFTVTNPPPPIVAFFGAPLAGVHPLPVTFSDLSTRNPTTWSWIFGDIGAGNTSTLQNPSHPYTTAGTYSVKLTVTNAGGSNTTTLSNYIIVT
jgi:PKD repeat protein